MTHFASFAIGGFVPSAAIAGVLVLYWPWSIFLSGIERTYRLLKIKNNKLIYDESYCSAFYN